MWRSCGRTPSRSATSRPSAYTASWRSIVGWPGASAYTKWLQTPMISAVPSACAFAAASTTAGQSSGVAPPRDRPVSILRWSRTGRSARLAAAMISLTWATLAALRSTFAATPSCSGRSGLNSQARTGAVMPARRRVNASPSVQAPSQVAPPSSAARAAGIMPCPYPSPLTTAMTAASVPARISATLPRIASRSTRTSACHMRPAYFPVGRRGRSAGPVGSGWSRLGPAGLGPAGPAQSVRLATTGRRAVTTSGAVTGPCRAASRPASPCA